MLKLLLFSFSAIFGAFEKDTVKHPKSAEYYIASSNPQVLKTDLQISFYAYAQYGSVRIVFDSLNKVYYMNTFEGDIYRIRVVGGVPQYRELFISKTNHSINRMQGLLYHNSALYMSGNESDEPNKRGKGRVIKVSFDSNGNNKVFTNVLSTEYYASSTTLFDHAFSAITLNKTSDSLLIASGSRTDHGEVKEVGGIYPNLRDEPLTTKIFIIPLNSSGIVLQNNELWLQNSGYIFCEGVRNEFDIALNGKGELFGLENMGDRDDPEELNLLKKGKHYGFPWRMGGNSTPMQFSPYYPNNDLLLPSNLATPGIFYDDPNFPTPPIGMVFEEPLKSIGPDANWVRNPTNGIFEQVDTVSTFTSHRSPLGLNIDVDSLLGYPYNASGFMLAYSSGGYLDNVDSGADLCQIKFIEDSFSGKYIVSVHRLIYGFEELVDAVLIGNELIIMERTGNIYKVTFPERTLPIANFTFQQDSDCLSQVQFSNMSNTNYNTLVWDFGDGNTSNQENPIHEFTTSGSKAVTLTISNAEGSNTKLLNINIPNVISLSGNSVKPKISGIEKIETTQNIQNQELFAEKSIQMNYGFETLPGATFSSKIITGCQ